MQYIIRETNNRAGKTKAKRKDIFASFRDEFLPDTKYLPIRIPKSYESDFWLYSSEFPMKLWRKIGKALFTYPTASFLTKESFCFWFFLPVIF